MGACPERRHGSERRRKWAAAAARQKRRPSARSSIPAPRSMQQHPKGCSLATMRPVACTNTGGPMFLGVLVWMGFSGGGRTALEGGRKETEGAWKVAAAARVGRGCAAEEQVTSTAACRRERRLADAAAAPTGRRPRAGRAAASGRQGDCKYACCGATEGPAAQLCARRPQEAAKLGPSTACAAAMALGCWLGRKGRCWARGSGAGVRLQRVASGSGCGPHLFRHHAGRAASAVCAWRCGGTSFGAESAVQAQQSPRPASAVRRHVFGGPPSSLRAPFPTPCVGTAPSECRQVRGRNLCVPPLPTAPPPPRALAALATASGFGVATAADRP